MNNLGDIIKIIINAIIGVLAALSAAHVNLGIPNEQLQTILAITGAAVNGVAHAINSPPTAGA